MAALLFVKPLRQKHFLTYYLSVCVRTKGDVSKTNRGFRVDLESRNALLDGFQGPANVPVFSVIYPLLSTYLFIH